MTATDPVPEFEDALDDLWAKARALKACPDLSVLDPERTLFLDMILKSPFNNACHYPHLKNELAAKEKKFLDYFLDNKENPSQEESIAQSMREIFMSKAVIIAFNHKMEPIPGSSPRDEIESFLVRTDPKFQIWMGSRLVHR